jgi:hypothetical protein
VTSDMRSSLAFVVAILAVAASATAQDLAPGQARAVARDAYVFTYPLVMNYRTMYMHAMRDVF